MLKLIGIREHRFGFLPLPIPLYFLFERALPPVFLLRLPVFVAKTGDMIGAKQIAES